MIEYFYCPCCGETGKLKDGIDLLFAGLVVECECGAKLAVLLKEIDDEQSERAAT